MPPYYPTTTSRLTRQYHPLHFVIPFTKNKLLATWTVFTQEQYVIRGPDVIGKKATNINNRAGLNPGLNQYLSEKSFSYNCIDTTTSNIYSINDYIVQSVCIFLGCAPG